nr:hypothetical protein [Otarine picobirnavirus]
MVFTQIDSFFIESTHMYVLSPRPDIQWLCTCEYCMHNNIHSTRKEDI